MDTAIVSKIFAKFKKENPTPTTELNYKSNFELLIAVILSAQATDISVNLATKDLFKKAGTAKKMYSLGEEGLKFYIKSIGLFNSKASNAIKTCKILIDKHDGEVPKTREELEELPGVGRKTANVVLNTAYKIPTIAVDTHIYRVSNRIGLAKATTPLAVEQQLLEIIPSKYKLDAHHWLILHGRYTCTARKPRCYDCAVAKLCEFEDKQEA